MDWQSYLADTGIWFRNHGLPILVILVITVVALKVAMLLVDRLAASITGKNKEEGHESWIKTFATVFGWVVRVGIFAAASVLILGQLGVDLSPVGLWFRDHGIPIFVILFVTVGALKVATLVVSKLATFMTGRRPDPEYAKRAKTLSSVIGWIIKVGVFAVAFVMILDEVGVQIGPVIAAAGVVGLAVGFGAQTLVQDVITGFFILLEDQVRVGDVVQIGDKGGLVENVNLRMVILRDLAGNVHYIRNGKIDIVTNMTKEYSRYVFNVGVAYRENVDEVITVLKKIDEEMRADPAFKDDIIAPLEVMGLDQFGDSAVIIKARTTTKPILQWKVGREFNRRMKQKFDDLGIEIPFPHRTIYIGVDKKGSSPPLNVVQAGVNKEDDGRAELPPS